MVSYQNGYFYGKMCIRHKKSYNQIKRYQHKEEKKKEEVEVYGTAEEVFEWLRRRRK